ncbi:MAG TPA: PEP-CTERM sorting domain-containing protein [Bryobacteraceae bacterium]|nr:PEP-CTERM sorting domain-containing protein [Bryobacteraceae bacterium]
MRLVKWITALWMMAAGVPAGASTMIVSNFGPGNSYNTNTSDFWVTPSLPEVGDPIEFIDPSNMYYTLIQIQVGDGLLSGSTTGGGVYNAVNVGFWESSTSNLSSAVEIESWNLLTPAMQQSDLFTLTSDTNPVIKPDDYYFVTVNVLPDPTPATAQALWAWQWNTVTPAENETVESDDDGYEGLPPIFAISADPDDPEPASVVLMAAGIGGLLGLAWRRSRRAGRARG